MKTILFVACTLALGACAVPSAWAPPPPAGQGYEYRFSGVYQKSFSSGSDTSRIGRVRITSHYAFGGSGVSEQEVRERLWTELPQPGETADGRFNQHLGERGETLRSAP